MTHLRTNIALKTGAVILTVLLTTTLFFSILSVGCLALGGAYSDPTAFRARLLEALATDESHQVWSWITTDSKDPSAQIPLPTEYRADSTNFRFTVLDADGKVVLSNRDGVVTASDYSYTQTLTVNADAYSESRTFSTTSERQAWFYEIQQKAASIQEAFWGAETDEEGNALYVLTLEWVEGCEVEFEISYTFQSPMIVEDGTYLLMEWVDQLLGFRWGMLLTTAILLILLIFLFVYLCWSAGHRRGRDDPQPNLIDRIPFDLYLAGLACLVVLTVVVWFLMADYVAYTIVHMDLMVLFVIVTVACVLLLGSFLVSLLLTFATRVKCQTVLRNTIIWRLFAIAGKGIRRVFRFIRFFIENLPLYWKAGLVIIAMLIAELVILLLGNFSYAFIVLAIIGGNLVLIPVSVYCIVQFRKLRDAASRIAAGDTAYRVDTSLMVMEFKEHGEALNGIREGMQKAVDERMKSEHFKTELITNVSHDIKTPLTSIINYVDLLKKEEVEPQSVREYIAVLDRQSARLKKLIEDLVEASKASTGNLSVHTEPLDLNLLLSQTIAEFDEKLRASELEVVTNLTADQSSMVIADGRLLWRVFENLMSNVCKYGQERTRLYVSTEVVGKSVRVVLKNTSKYALNISSEELMERFTRGDASRHTEGSGLGLSIARSLVELQNGKFSITIDGDLFKVIVELPQSN